MAIRIGLTNSLKGTRTGLWKNMPNHWVVVTKPLHNVSIDWESHEKKTLDYREREEKAPESDLWKIRNLASEQIVYIDESGIEETIHREYARAPRGPSVRTSITGRKTRRINMRVRTRRLLAPCLFEENIDTNVFNAWLEQGLLKELQPGAVVVMDNASFHKSAQTRQLLKSAHCQLIFLPTDSPDLNNI